MDGEAKVEKNRKEKTRRVFTPRIRRVAPTPARACAHKRTHLRLYPALPLSLRLRASVRAWPHAHAGGLFSSFFLRRRRASEKHNNSLLAPTKKRDMAETARSAQDVRRLAPEVNRCVVWWWGTDAGCVVLQRAGEGALARAGARPALSSSTSTPPPHASPPRAPHAPSAHLAPPPSPPLTPPPPQHPVRPQPSLQHHHRHALLNFRQVRPPPPGAPGQRAVHARDGLRRV